MIGILLRIPFIPFIGFEQDFLFFTSWANYIDEHGIITIYDDPTVFEHDLINYPPVYLYFLGIFASFYRLFFAGAFESRLFLALIKCTTVIFEILISLLLFKWLESRGETKSSNWGAAFFFLNPAVFYVSVYYGQVDAIFSAFLLAALFFLIYQRAIWSGIFLALAIFIKVQTIPYVPLFCLAAYLLLDGKKIALFLVGLSVTSLLILSPFIITERLSLLWLRCVQENIEWGQMVTVGAFNPWYLHIDPSTLDKRIWGFLFGEDNQLSANFVVQWLTYKNLGMGLFGCAFLGSLYWLFRYRDSDNILLAFSHLALAFYMLPTKVHERYLFPFLVFYVPLVTQKRTRLIFLVLLSATYLLNLYSICPLFGPIRDVTEIDSVLGVWAASLNLMIYILFVSYEFITPFFPKQKLAKMLNAFCLSLILLIGIHYWRYEIHNNEPNFVYLSDLTPVYSKQDWPVIPAEFGGNPPPGYGIGMDLSIDGNQLRIKDVIYRYGLGAHAQSRIEYEIPGIYDLFMSKIGVDAEAFPLYEEHPGWGTVEFEVLVNGESQYKSPLMIPHSEARDVVVRLPKKEDGKNNLVLIVHNYDNDSKGDHADWALARVIRTSK